MTEGKNEDNFFECGNSKFDAIDFAILKGGFFWRKAMERRV